MQPNLYHAFEIMRLKSCFQNHTFEINKTTQVLKYILLPKDFTILRFSGFHLKCVLHRNKIQVECFTRIHLVITMSFELLIETCA